MPVSVVMLGHKAQVGKDTLGEFLVSELGYLRFGFADKLKEVVADLYDFNHEQMYGELKNTPDKRYLLHPEVPNCTKSFYTPRMILQYFGQEQRARFPDIWADYVCRQIESHLDPEDNVVELAGGSGFVITDFRFPNEAAVAERYCKKLNINLVQIKITRPDEYRGNFAGSMDVSETALDDYEDWDYHIHNDGTIPELFEKYLNLGI